MGHRISNDTIYPDERKIEKVKDWEFPQTAVQMLSFLGLVNYYRDLIPWMSDIAEPLYPLGKELKIQKTPELEARFKRLKTAVCSNPVVHLHDLSKPFILETDSSQVALGAVLKQKSNKPGHENTVRTTAKFSTNPNVITASTKRRCSQ